MIQHPHVPAEVALVFKGQKGVGKGTFARALMKMSGAHGKQVAQPEHFLGRFNEHLQNCIFLFVDEGYWAGNPGSEGALKNLITEPVLTFEPKGRPVIHGPNMIHMVIASNEDWVVPATPDERRFAVFEADHAAREKLPLSFFDDLDKEIRSGGLNAALYDLMAMDIENWHPRGNIPKTQALTEQKVQGFRRDYFSAWWYENLEKGNLGIDFMDISWRKGVIDVKSAQKEMLLQQATEVARGMKKYGPLSLTLMARYLSKVGVQMIKDNKGERAWRIPPLVDARKAFENYVGGTITWDN